jgi:hypothetical protein
LPPKWAQRSVDIAGVNYARAEKLRLEQAAVNPFPHVPPLDFDNHQNPERGLRYLETNPVGDLRPVIRVKTAAGRRPSAVGKQDIKPETGRDLADDAWKRRFSAKAGGPRWPEARPNEF